MDRFRGQSMLLAGGAVLAAAAFLSLQRKPRSARAEPSRARRRVVVVGGGFGGLELAVGLAGAPGVDLTVIDARNHHLFQPLLYQVATGSLSPADIATPLRELLPVSDRLQLLMAEVTGVDVEGSRVRCRDGRSVPFDILVLATGSRTSYFGHRDWAAAAPGVKSLDDALGLRNAVLSALERASDTLDESEQTRLLTFVIVGAGPTGVEMAGALAELASDFVARSPQLLGRRPRIVLLDARARVLPEFADELSTYAARVLRTHGVEIRTGKRVTAVQEGQVELDGESLQASTIIWAAGSEATPVAAWLGVKPGHGGRVAVNDSLQILGHPSIYVIGDAALAHGPDGRLLPALAAVAKQQGRYVSDAIMRRIRGELVPAPFRYRDYGTLATIGRNEAVAELGWIHITGHPAWLMWAAVHIAFLISFRSKVLVSAQWALAYLTNRRSAGLIVGPERSDQPPVLKPG